MDLLDYPADGPTAPLQKAPGEAIRALVDIDAANLKPDHHQ